MNVASWNCRVLGSADSPKAPYVSSLVRSFEIEFMFLIETLVPVNVAVDKLSSLAFDGFCGSDALGLSGGDFNQVKYLVDKLGGAPSILGRYDFLNWKIASGLVDIPFTGSPFTWTNGQLGNPTFERLDKGYASCSWLESHPDAMAHTLFLYWKQRSKVRWDDFGETNSHLLLSSVQDRRRRNKIFSLKDNHGNWISDPMGIENLLIQHFSDLYNCQKNPATNIPELWDELDIPMLSSHHQQQLMAPFTAAEIKNAIFHIGNDKSPGPNGFTAAFFKSHWSIVGTQVTSTIQYFFARGYMLKDWNRTFLVLLAKVDHPDNPSQFRPIGLCNVLYKCISKCMTAQLRKILPLLNSESQSALTDNSLIAHELLSYMNSSTSKICSAALKLDMNKAYDRVNWEFLGDVLKASSFPPYWIQLIKQCVSTAEGNGLFQGLRISRRAPSVSHLFFADDALLFFRVNPTACSHLLGVIDRFCTISGQMVNVQKSFVKFSSNTPEDYREFLSSVLHMQAKNSLGSYLGLPVDLGRAKLVIASLNHVLSVFKLPATISDQIDRLLSHFWWKNNNSTRGIALTPSASLYLPRGLGGLGVRHVPSFNSALLTKKMWRLIHHPQLLVSRIYRARYPHLVNYKASNLPPRPSWGCRSLMEGARVLSQGVRWKVGSGSQINIIDDDWVPGVSVFPPPIADSILGMERPHEEMDDFVYWKFTWDGSFTTKSAYAHCEFTCLVRPSHHLEVIRTLPLDRDFSTWFAESISGFAAAKDWNGLDELLVFFWAIWLARNNIRFRSEVYSPAGIYAVAASWVSRSKEAKELSDRFQPSCPPGFGVSSLHDLNLGDPSDQYDICLASDGSWNAKDQRAGMGWFLSSDLSSPVVGGGAQAGFASSALHSELFACLLGLRHVQDRGNSSVRIFTDCCSVKILIGGQSSDTISVIWILREIRQIVAGLQRFHIQKVSRAKVGYAHHLTNLARSRHFICFRF
ncbi:uncharacterized protein LOC110727647 [Chenopodium quinoa]|uniref:uncharacterized protein LOC110727647 n=1 Tax=Chenopodium quinoa TaxID=63459 RepID=UPI000B771B82|nr:uncharacterized protein LOC110727647 [Chenopodium quinoa]